MIADSAASLKSSKMKLNKSLKNSRKNIKYLPWPKRTFQKTTKVVPEV
jgi:hypothetical protein